jgi:hypothetical protein
VVALGVLSTGVAYVLNYRLIRVWIFWGESKALLLHLTSRCRVT